VVAVAGEALRGVVVEPADQVAVAFAVGLRDSYDHASPEIND
jgi:hypothetical protein